MMQSRVGRATHLLGITVILAGTAPAAEADGGLKFDGRQAYLSTRNLPFGSYPQFTIEVWYRDWVGPILCQGQAGDPENSIWMSAGRPGQPRPEDASGWESNGGTNYQYNSGLGTPADWNHMALVYDGTQQSIFLNGQLKRRVQTPKPGPFHAKRLFYVGLHDYGKRRVFGTGTLRALRVSKSARYVAPFKPTERLAADAKTVLLYNLSQGSNSRSVNDLSSERRNASLRGAKWVAGHTRAMVARVQRRTELQEPPNHSGFFSFAVSGNGKLVAGGTGAGKLTVNGKSSGFGGEVLLWNAESGRLTRTLGQHRASVDWLRFSDDGRLLASCSRENQLVQIWELPSGKRLSTFQLIGPFNAFHPPVLSPDGGWLAAVAEVKKKIGDREIPIAGALTVWDTRSGKPKWSVPESSAKCLAASRNGDSLAAFVEEIQWSPGANGKLAGKYGKRAVTVWDTTNGRLRWQTDSVRFSPTQLRFHADRKRLLGLSSLTMMSWDLESGSVLDKATLGASGAGPRPSPHQLRLSLDGRSAGIVGFMGDHVELWDLANVKQLAGLKFKFPNTLRNAAFSPDLKSVVCVQNHDPVILHLSWKTGGSQP
ncbi:MAG: LamG-like jellyroll fold domain-containing protein [Planctomycetaceae bacterium]